MRALVALLPKPVGFVPTMGAIHAGHLALVERARRECASVIASIFVNPLQFGPNEDFDRYPRSFESDCEQLAAHGVAAVFAPGVADMYPPGFVTSVDPGAIGTRFEGALRKGHFSGVATVMTKLLLIVGPQALYMGQKDAQQAAILRRMVRDLEIPVRFVVVPTVREADGLALSSRNVYLSPQERTAAPRLHQALVAIAEAVANGEKRRDAALASGRRFLIEPLREAYLDVVDAQFETLERTAAPCIVIGSVWAGPTRLLDNLTIPDAAGADPLL